MAKGEFPWGPVIIGVAVLLVTGVIDLDSFGGGGSADTGGSSDGGTDISGLIQGTVEFFGARMFVPSTTISTEFVRVFNNGADEGQLALGSGSTNAYPGDKLTMYFGENSSTYYTDKQVIDSYPEKKGVKMSSELCQIDTSPTLTAFDKYGRPETSQTVAASETDVVSLEIKGSADTCYGNPESACAANALCIYYNTTEFQYVKATGGTMGTVGQPYNLTTVAPDLGSAYGYNCYKIGKVADGSKVNIDIEYKSTATNPSTDFTYYTKDCAFDLNADDNSEIWDFQDESNNVLGAAGATTTQQIG